MKIAIWGITGHVGQALYHTAVEKGIECHGYVRDLDKARLLLPQGVYSHFEDFPSKQYDILINAVAAGFVTDALIFDILEHWSRKLLLFSRENPSCVCFNISSGAVYGDNFDTPADDNTSFLLTPNNIKSEQLYGIAKLFCEQRNRANPGLPIVDLRMFAFFTRYMDIRQPFFMSDIIKALLSDDVFETAPNDFERDFIHPSDLLNMILICSEKKNNGCFDLYSCGPIKKSEIIALFEKHYGLKVKYGQAWTSATGTKTKYFSQSRKAAELGYFPVYTSKDILLRETDAILQRGVLEQ
jgi:nucleoside-diphosphate-sugar epimerase